MIQRTRDDRFEIAVSPHHWTPRAGVPLNNFLWEIRDRHDGGLVIVSGDSPTADAAFSDAWSAIHEMSHA